MLSLMGLVCHYYHDTTGAAAWLLTALLSLRHHNLERGTPSLNDSVTHSKFAWHGCLAAVSTKENKGLKIAVTLAPTRSKVARHRQLQCSQCQTPDHITLV